MTPDQRERQVIGMSDTCVKGQLRDWYILGSWSLQIQLGDLFQGVDFINVWLSRLGKILLFVVIFKEDLKTRVRSS